MLRREQKGWVGIDIGSASVKVAQLARSDGHIRVLATAQVSRSTYPPRDSEDAAETLYSAAGEIRTAIAIGGGFRGRHAAAVIPMGLCDVHQVSNLAPGDTDLDHEVRSAIETVTQCSADHLEFDVWSADPANQRRWNVLAVGRPWSDRVYYDVVESGYDCHTIDGVPQALARALRLAAPNEAGAPTAVLDWGYSQATFCLVANGVPVYVRVLKDCSFQAALAGVADELGVTTDEASLLLEKYGARGLNFRTDDEVVTMVADLIAEPVRHLVGELEKTLTHVGFQYRNLAPRRLVLFGGGSLVGGIPRHLTRKLRLETQQWLFESNDPRATKHDPLYGIAIALSSLAWEEE